MENNYSILLVEDEPKLSQLMQAKLQEEGFKVDVALDGLTAEKKFKLNNYSLVILDVNLPYKNGLSLCKEFREQNAEIPILMLTALGQVKDKVDAFNLGADDYLVKPFHFDELLARIKVFLKRLERTQQQNNVVDNIQLGDLHIDMFNKSVTRQGKLITLTAKEFGLLVLLAKEEGKVISKQEILEKVWGLNFDTGTNTIEVYISFLRNKIDKEFDSKLIHTKPGFGYYIKP